jgi:hypothetical protein
MQRQKAVSSAVFLMVVSVSGLAAQQTEMKLALNTPKTNARAEKIKRQAEALYERPAGYQRAAALHELEAAARADTDPLRVEALDRAARLYVYTGDVAKGRTLMAKAARQALSRGDVARAANAFIDAAFMAMREGDRQLVNDLTQEAALLALSPLLSARERVAIQRRIDPARAHLSAYDH